LCQAVSAWSKDEPRYERKYRNPNHYVHEDAWNQFVKQDGKCALSGYPLCLDFTNTDYSRKTASLDRIDNNKGYEKENRKKIFDFYLDNLKYVNNWDLVDTSADKIVGRFLFDEKADKDILDKLTQSQIIWERRVAIVSTFYFIKQKEFALTFKICELLMKDKHDLIHKACGWMLRKAGK
jgi:3-methyladenine DNA glycosylase AlkD